MGMSELIALGGAVVGVAAAAAAFWQAREARKSRLAAEKSSEEAAALAAESNAAWKSIAESQKVVAQAHRPKAWGVTKRGTGDLWTIRNTSERAILVERIDVKPDSAQPLLEVDGELPRIFRAGELLEFYARARMSLSIRTVTIVWRFDGEDLQHDSTRSLAAH